MKSSSRQRRLALPKFFAVVLIILPFCLRFCLAFTTQQPSGILVRSKTGKKNPFMSRLHVSKVRDEAVTAASAEPCCVDHNINQQEQEHHNLEEEEEEDMPKNYVRFPSSGITKSQDWKFLCPPPVWQNWLWNMYERKRTSSKQQTYDVTIQWSADHDGPQQVAQQLLQEFSSATTTIQPGHIQTIAQALTQFRDLCQERLDLPSTTTTVHHQYKVRLVATRGKPGTKCPQWHIDHVPCRWIQSLVGPGCDMVLSSRGIEWDIFQRGGLEESKNDDDDDSMVSMSIQKRNQALVDESVADIQQAAEMEAWVLMGNQWNEYTKDDKNNRRTKPVVHKSPFVPWNAERVLLTQDVIFPES